MIICSVWVVISMSKKRLLMSEGYECPGLVQSGQLMSGRLRSPPTQSTFIYLFIMSYLPRSTPSVRSTVLPGAPALVSVSG